MRAARPRVLSQPAADHRDHVSLLLGREDPPLFDAVPFREASPATCRGRVLRDKDRVPAEWRLLAIVPRVGRCEALRDESLRVLENSRQSLGVKISALMCAEIETLTKRRKFQGGEKVVQMSHHSGTAFVTRGVAAIST